MFAVARRNGPYLLVFLLAAWLFCFHRLGAVGVFDLDEGLYSTASRQMLESRDFVVPRIGTEVRFAKPPLIYWIQAPCMALFGFTPFAVRLPSALCIVGTALLLWAHALRRGQNRAGWLAALVFLCCPLSMVLARQGIIDALLTFCLTLTVFGWCQAADGRRSGWMLMAAGMGLSVLAKGLLGVVVPGFALLLWLFLQRGNYSWKRVPWLAMILLVLVIAVPWHLLMYQATGQEFIKQYFLSNHFNRFTGQQWGHRQPFWFYVPIILAGMFPWSGLVPVTWWRGLREDGDPLNKRIWALWALVIFGFFSISKSKLPGYILPAFAPLSLLVGSRLDELWTERRAPNRAESFSLLILPLLIGLTGIGGGFLGQSWRGQSAVFLFGKKMTPSTVETLVFLSPWLWFLGAMFTCGAVALFVLRGDTKRLTACLVTISCSLPIVVLYGGLADYNRKQIRPLHELALAASPGLERGERVAIFNLRPRRPSLRYVLGHTAQLDEIETYEPKKLRAAIQGRAGYIIAMKDARLPALPVTPRLESTSAKWALYRWRRR